MTITATPTMIRSGRYAGEWGAKVQGAAAVNDLITITARSGKTWRGRVQEIVWSNDQVAICLYRPVKVRATAAPRSETSDKHQSPFAGMRGWGECRAGLSQHITPGRTDMRETIPLSDEQIESIFEEAGTGLTIDDLGFTRETFADFRDSRKSWSDRGELLDEREIEGYPVMEILRAQAIKGQPRRDLVIIDFGPIRAFYHG